MCTSRPQTRIQLLAQNLIAFCNQIVHHTLCIFAEISIQTFNIVQLMLANDCFICIYCVIVIHFFRSSDLWLYLQILQTNQINNKKISSISEGYFGLKKRFFLVICALFFTLLLDRRDVHFLSVSGIRLICWVCSVFLSTRTYYYENLNDI